MALLATFCTEAARQGESLGLALVNGRHMIEQSLVRTPLNHECMIGIGFHCSGPIERTQLALQILHQWLCGQSTSGDTFTEFTGLEPSAMGMNVGAQPIKELLELPIRKGFSHSWQFRTRTLEELCAVEVAQRVGGEVADCPH